MSANELLLWMSARAKGSWQQFRAAVEELHLEDSDSGIVAEGNDETGDQFALPLYRLLRLNLQRLAHVEFFAGAGESDWRVTPPSLALTRHTRGWIGVLAGARSSQLLQRVERAAVSTHVEKLQFPACPDQIRMIADDARALTAVAVNAGLLPQTDAPSAILTNLPTVDDPEVRRPADMPFGADWRVERFSTSELRWKAATREDALSTSVGLFRFSLRHQRHVLFCSRGAAFRVPGQVGKYAVLRLRRRRILLYDAVLQRLSVPASCRPPFLVERALILCSGSPPSYEAGSAVPGVLNYSDVPETVASLVTALLRQELR